MAETPLTYEEVRQYAKLNGCVLGIDSGNKYIVTNGDNMFLNDTLEEAAEMIAFLRPGTKPGIYGG